ncbi:MAG: thymidine phosphorylase, partial [Elusimicrobiota bacterium]
IPESRMAAFLMAVFFRGMDFRECFDFTMSMVESGKTADLSKIKGFKIDKHSTGGVGDKTTLVLAPLVAACGGIVPKMSGKELGHTGGTIDKLKSIPGFRVEMPPKEFTCAVNKTGAAIIAQMPGLAGADKLIYSLRDATATVESIPLIASSIMSKKIASGADGIVLDVKTGLGAFMNNYDHALELADLMLEIGQKAGKKVSAVITSMEEPLGYAVGNFLEVAEAAQTLKGEGPRDLIELVLELGSEMLIISSLCSSKPEAEKKLMKALKDGSAFVKFREIISCQGGNAKVLDNPADFLKSCKKFKLKAPKKGWVHKMDAFEIGVCSKLLGAGRDYTQGEIDYKAGIVLKKKIGDKIKKGETLAVFYYSKSPDNLNKIKKKFMKACIIGDKNIAKPDLVYARRTVKV